MKLRQLTVREIPHRKGKPSKRMGRKVMGLKLIRARIARPSK